MNLGFYYHISLHSQDERLYLPGYLAVFVDSLAEQVDQLLIFAHEADGADVEAADCQLNGSNITWVNLGKKSPTWHRSIFHRKFLAKIQRELDFVDAIIVRSPTPLAPYFHKFIARSKIVFMIVGNYSEGARNYKAKSIRDIAIKIYMMHNHWLFDRQVTDARVMVNSPKLHRIYEARAKEVQKVITTTITESDFHYREDSCNSNPISILYTGRIDPLKGLFELVQSLVLLREAGYEVILHLVGWEYGGGTKVIRELETRAKELDVGSYLVFHGKKALGKELNQMYRMADIYVIPTYFEGFPRTIWEAMANGLPVIASNVGGIPYYLSDKENVLLIEPRSSDQIVTAVQTIIENDDLRRRLIRNALTTAKEVTVSSQTKKMIEIIESFQESD